MYQVYVWTNKKSGKRYVGSTKQEDVLKRAAYGDGYRGSPVFHKAIKEEGLEAFDVRVMAVVDSRQQAHALEEYFIELYKTRNPEYGYNVYHSGYPVENPVTAERNAKISSTLKKQRGNSSYKARMSDRMQTVWDNDERRARMLEKRRNLAHYGGVPRVKVKIVELDKTFDNKGQAARYLGLTPSALARCKDECRFRSKKTGKLYTVRVVSE